MYTLGLNYFIYIIYDEYTIITIQPLYKWGSEESQIACLNIYPKSLGSNIVFIFLSQQSEYYLI